MTDSFPVTPLNQVKRVPERGQYDRETIYPIVDTALICHVGFALEGQPYVIPTLHVRDGDSIILHGASTSRMIKHLAAGNPASITVTHVEALVLARSVFNHSINYRSAVLFGRGTVVDNPDEKMDTMRLLTEKIMPGRWEDARLPTPNENKATTMVRIHIESASAKIRTGPPGDNDEDYDLPIWAGIVPFTTEYAPPEPDPKLRDGVDMPGYLRDFVEKG